MRYKVSQLKEERRAEIMTNTLSPIQHEDLVENTSKLAVRVRETGKFMSESEMEKAFKPMWESWTTASPEDIKPADITEEVHRVLLKFYLGHQREVNDELWKTPLSHPRQTMNEVIPHDEMQKITSPNERHETSTIQSLWNIFGKPKEPQHKLQEICKNLAAKVDEWKKDSKFSQDRVYEILQHNKKLFEEHNVKPKYRYNFTAHCERKIAVQILRYAIPIFHKVEMKYNDTKGTKAKIKERKMKVFFIFKETLQHREIEI